MNRTIIESCGQKRERRNKFACDSPSDDSSPHGKSSSTRGNFSEDDVLNLHQLKKQIQQKFSVPETVTSSKQHANDLLHKNGQGSRSHIEADAGESCQYNIQLYSNQNHESMQLEQISNFEEELNQSRASKQNEICEAELFGQVFSTEFSAGYEKLIFSCTDKETESTKCLSVTINSTKSNPTLEQHLINLANSLRDVHKNPRIYAKESIYQEIHRFIKNFQRIELDYNMLVRKRIGIFLSNIFNLLREIRDSNNMTYSRLLTDANMLISKVKRQLLEFVRFTCDSVQNG